MSVVLVLEPDSSQAAALRRVIKRVGAELVLVDSTTAAIDAIKRRIPDLILLSTLLSPRDEDRLIAHLRSLEGTSHIQTLTIPLFHSEQKSTGRKGSLFRKKQQSAPTGCDPALFAEEIVAHLARAAEERSHPPVAASIRFAKPAPLEIMPALEAVAQAEPEALLEMPGLMKFDSVDDEEMVEPQAVVSAVESDAIISAVEREAIIEGSSVAEPIALVDDEVQRVANELGLDLATSSAASASSEEASIDVIAEIARIQAEAQAEAEARIATEVGHVRVEAEARRLAEIALVQAEADEIREAAIAEARAAAELEARETLAAEMARVRSEAESTFAEALNKVKIEAEQTLGVEIGRAREDIGRAREDVEALKRLRTEAQEAFTAELARVRSNVERTLSVQLDTARAEAERVRVAEAEIARVRAEAEAEAERVRAAEAEVARVRTEADARLKAELARAREEADRASWVEKTKAKQATLQIKEEAAVQARAVAQAEARRALDAEIARVKTEANASLEAEKAHARAEAEARQAAQLQKLHEQMAEMRAAAAQQARAAAAEAVLAEVARASSQSKLTIVRSEPNVIPFRPVAAPPPVAVERPHGHARVMEAALSQVAQEALSTVAHAALSNKDESIKVESIKVDSDSKPVAQPAAKSKADYYSLWQMPSSRAKVEQQSDEQLSDEQQSDEQPWLQPQWRELSRLGVRAAKWALPIAACLLLITYHGAALSMLSWLVGSSETAPEKEIVLADTSPELFVSRAEPKTAELTVESTPAGAEVLLDGQSYGQTPVTIRKLKPGTYRMVLRGDAGTIARRITVKAGEAAVASEAIFAGWLAIFSPIPLEIFLDGRFARPNDEGRIMARPGKYQVEMVSEQFKYRVIEPLEVRPGEVTAHTVSLPMGSVHVTAPEGTEIRLEGEVVGRTPLDDLSIAIGTHDITATHPEAGQRRLMVDVRHGEVADVKFFSE